MEENRSPNIPPMEDIFIELIRSKRLVLFVGAGISKLCGYPLWDQLANNLIEKFRENNKYDYLFEESIKNGPYSPIQKITILSQYDGIGEEKVTDAICEALKKPGDENAKEISSYLFAFESSIVTTNADEILDNADVKNSYKHISSVEKLRNRLDDTQKRIVHLHGCVSDRQNLVFTETQYAMKYMPTGKIGKYLTSLIKSEKAILFIGYSLREFELLKYLIGPADQNSGNHLYALMPYFHHEEKTKLELDKKYYQALGIKIIPYFKDENGYDELKCVLKDWASKIKERFSPIGDLYVTIADLIAKEPTKNAVNIIASESKNLDPFFLQKKIEESKYFCEWIEALWNRSQLFKPKIALGKNASETGVLNYISGLQLIRDYVSRKKRSDSLEERITELMRQSARLIKQRGNSLINKFGDSISIHLIDIVKNRGALIAEERVFEPISELYISQNEYGAYMLAEDFIKARKALIEEVTHERLFFIISKLAKSDERDFEHFKVLKSPSIKDFILTCPQKYYSEALAFLEKTDWGFSHIGCFSSFPFETNSFLFKEQMYGYWLFISSAVIDNQILKRDIERLLNSEKSVTKKIGLCLMGLRFQENRDFFIDHLETFFNDSSYIPDLIELLKRNIDVIRKDEILKRHLKDNLDNATFGSKDKDVSLLFKKAIANVLVNADSNNMFLPTPLSKQEKDSLFFYSSSASFYTTNRDSEIEEIYKQIKGKELHEAIEFINSLKDRSSSYIDRSVAKAIDKYLKPKEFKSYRDKIKEFGDNYFLTYLSNKEFIPLTNDGAERYVYLVRLLTKKEQKEHIDSILFSCSEFMKSIEISDSLKEALLSIIDYSLIDLKEKDQENITIGAVVNCPLHLYWSILSDYATVNEESFKKRFIESIDYFYENQKDTRLLKGVMALWIGYIYKYSGEKKDEFFDFVFNKGNCISSYKLFSYLQGNRDMYLEKLCSLDGFESFILNTADKGWERSSLAANIILSYLSRGSFESTYVKVIRNQDMQAIETAFKIIEKRPGNFINARFDSFLDGCIQSIENQKTREFKANMLFSCLVGLMEKEESICSEKVWKLISLIPAKMSYYHGSSIIRLLERFGASDPQHCVSFLDSLFDSYDSSYIYDGEIVQIISFVFKTDSLKDNAQRWLTKIGNKKPALYQELDSKGLAK